MEIQENIKKWNIPMPQQDYMVVIQCSTYNHEAYIEDAMKGFVMQITNFPFCALVTDDCSTDGTAEIIKRFAAKYPDIIIPILLGENHMQHKISRDPYLDPWHNRAKYIAICEGDDYWTDPYKLQKQVDFMERHLDCSMVFHNADIKDESTGFFRGPHRIYKKSRYAELAQIVRDGGFIPTLSVLFRPALFSDYHRFPQDCPAGDLKRQTFAAMVGKVYYINQIMGVYRLVPTSDTHVAWKSLDRFVERHQGFIRWYNEVNTYTHREYNKEIQGAIAFSEARILNAEGRYSKLWHPKYFKFIWNEPINSRIGLLLRMMGLKGVYERCHRFLEQRRAKK